MLLVLVILIAFLQTSAGKSVISSLLSRLLSSSPERVISIGKIEGMVPFDIQVARVSANDSEGEWLSAENVLLRWSAAALLHGKILIEDLSASTINFERLPAAAPVEKKAKWQPRETINELKQVRVEHLAVGSLSIGQAILGQSAVFRIESQIMNEPVQKILFNLERIDQGPKTSADIEASLDGNPLVLYVQAAFREEPGGLAGKLMGIEPAPLYLALYGKGPVAEWKGTVQGSAGGYGSTSADIALRIDHESIVDLNGKIQLAEPFLPPRLAPVLGGENSFSLTSRYLPEKYVAIEAARLIGKGYRGDISGGVDLETHEIRSAWSLDAAGVAAPEGSGALNIKSEVSARGSLSGKLEQPEGSVSVLFKRSRADGVELEQIQTELQIEPLRREKPASSGLVFKGTSRAKTAYSPSGNRPESLITWSIEAENRETDRLFLTLFLQNEQNILNAKADVNTGNFSGNLDASLKMMDLKPVGIFAGKDIQVPVSLDLRIQASGSESLISGNIQGQVGRGDDFEPPFSVLLGSESVFSGSFKFEGTRVDLSDFKFENKVVHLTGHAAADLSDRRWQGEWRLNLPNLEPLAPAAGTPFSGSLDLRDTFSGSIEALEHKLLFTGNNLVVSGRKLPELTGTLEVRDIPDSPRGTIHLDAQRGGQKLSASTAFSLRNRQISLPSITVEFPAGKLYGNVSLDLLRHLLQGEIDGASRDLGPAARIIGEEFGGSADLKVKFSPGKKGQEIKSSVNGTNISGPFGRIEKATLSADLVNALRSPEGAIKLDIAQWATGGMVLSTGKAAIITDEKGGSFSGSGNGRYREKFNFDGQGGFARTKGSEEFRLSNFKGSYGDRPFSLSQPLVVVRSGTKTSFERLALVYGRGKISAAGSLDAKRVKLDADLEKMDLDIPPGLVAPDLAGTANGHLSIEGDSVHPSASLNLHIEDIRSKDLTSKKIQLPRVDVEATVTGGAAKINAQAQSPKKGSIKANVSVPVNFSLQPVAFSVPPQGALKGLVEGRTDLSTLAVFIPSPDHELTGQADARFDIGGTTASPQVSGSFQVEKGTYQNLAQGTVLKDLQIDVTASGRRIEIAKLRATDGGKGTLSGQGWIDVDVANHFPMSIDIVLSNLELIRRPDATAILSGTLKATGADGKIEMNGQLETSTGEVLLQKPHPVSIAEMNVIEIHGGSAPPPAQTASAVAPSNVTVSIKINMPGKVFVRGRGLDSEWKGDLTVSGAGGKQVFTGSLTTVRGNFDFLGKRFNVTNGVIRFYGGNLSASTMDLTAEAQAKDITARLLLRGPFASPEIKLESDPPYPSDEILARVLFNRAAGNISPTQAVRLADALRTLSGRGSVLDFLGRTRQVLGLEQLEVRDVAKSSKQTEMGVGIGKYLTEDIYVDVEKGVSNETGKVSARIDITPHITIEGEAGLISEGIGILWKKDY